MRKARAGRWTSCAVEDGSLLQSLELPPWNALIWAADEAIICSDARTDVNNLWRAPLDGGPHDQLAHFESDQIFEFNALPGGGFALSRGRRSNDVVLLENFR